MFNVFDYLSWRGDISFNEVKLNEIDNLILSMVVYAETGNQKWSFPSINKMKLGEYFEGYFLEHPISDAYSGALLDIMPAKLAKELVNHKRFSEIYLSNYINEIDNSEISQFSATSFILNDEYIYVSYKGTDDTIVGWIENFNMMSVFPVPAQKKALKYFEKIVKLYPNHKFYLGGHSKGGNLAMYTAIYTKYKDKIECVYSNDGPGFTYSKIDINKFDLIRDKIIQIVPYDCVIGNLLEIDNVNRIVVKTTKKGMNSHNGFLWTLMGSKFISLDDVSKKSISIDKEFTSIISNLTAEESDKLTEAFKIIAESDKINTLTDLRKNFIKVLFSLRKIDSETKKTIFKLFKIVIKNSIN